MGLDRRRLLQWGGFAGLGAASGGAALGVRQAFAQSPALAPAPGEVYPDEIMNPIEVTGAEAVAVVGRLPGARRMYLLPDGKGEFHRIGSMVMTRAARPAETGATYEVSVFTGPAGSVMPRHAHLSSHAALVVLGGEVEVELAGQTWTMLKGDFANIPPGTSHGWTMKSDKGKLALFSIGDRVGSAFTAMGMPATTAALSGAATAIPPGRLALASFAGDFQLRPGASGPSTRVTNLIRPTGPGPYVLLDGGGERYGGNTFCAKNDNTGGQFLFIMSEGGPGPGVGAHFHARHTEDFFGMDGEVSCWAYGKDVRLHAGDLLQAPPRHMHGFRMMSPYARFIGFLTPGIFENFFTGGRAGRNGVGGRGAGEGSPPSPPGAGRGGPPGAPPGGLANPNATPGQQQDRFRGLSMSSRGPDGYPLDVHGPTKPLPPQEGVWKTTARDSEGERLALLQHADSLCGGGVLGQAPMSAQLRRAMSFKPKAESFI